MSYESMAIILMIIAIVLILLEFVWLYIIAQKQEDFLKKRSKRVEDAENQLKAILSSPTKSARDEEIQNYVKLCKKNKDTMLCGVSVYLDYKRNEDQLSDERKLILQEVHDELNPVDELTKLLSKSNVYYQSFICRSLGELDADSAVEDIRKCLKSKNKRLKYNAGMALSSLGDEDGVISFLNYCQHNNKYSYRVEMELMDLYTGDKAQLVRRFFTDNKDVDDYMKATIIKAVKDDRLEELKDIYIDGFSKKNPQIRVACVKAMAEIGTRDLGQFMITASMDNDWIIRLSSITGLEKMGTPDCIEALKRLTSDSQWWVRKRASESLVRADNTLETVEGVINGYDRYAADAVKEYLYKNN